MHLFHKECFITAVECHHNDIANYIFQKYLYDEDQKSSEYLVEYLSYYNYAFIGIDLFVPENFKYFFQYNYPSPLHIAVKQNDYETVELLLSYDGVDTNLKDIIFF